MGAGYPAVSWPGFAFHRHVHGARRNGRVGVVGVGAVGFHGGLHAHPAARYGAAVATGAAIGAAAASVPCYNPACGYYPYPPCY
ncbi:hypothetical protein EV128_11335 [Rhizobium azibense]|nr:hypothetical protein EV128_11335 [Rhizobium azibense]